MRLYFVLGEDTMNNCADDSGFGFDEDESPDTSFRIVSKPVASDLSFTVPCKFKRRLFRPAVFYPGLMFHYNMRINGAQTCGFG